MAQIKLVLLALTFYTRLPSPIALDYQDLGRATIYFPVIGWLIGLLTALGFYGANLLWSQSTAVIIALMVGVLLTGALHEDGVADVCDGFGGGYGKQRILEIMKDSHIGVYGVLGLVLLLMLKISVLTSFEASQVPGLLFVGHSISRAMPLLLMQRYQYARSSDSKAALAVYRPTSMELCFALTCACLPFLVLPWVCLLAWLPVLAMNSYLGRYFQRHIEGYTGDCLGASQQVAETLFYLTAQALWTFI